MQELRIAQRVLARMDECDLLRARRAAREMSLELRAAARGELPLDVVEEIDFLWMSSGHHSFDYSRSVLVPSNSARRLRPRKILDFTVPSATPVSSAISA